MCAHSGEWMKYSAAGRYTVVSSASVLGVRNTAALTPQTTHYSKGPKRPLTLPLSPSLATRLSLRDLDLQLRVDYFISPDSLPSIVLFCLFPPENNAQTTYLAVTLQPPSAPLTLFKWFYKFNFPLVGIRILVQVTFKKFQFQ